MAEGPVINASPWIFFSRGRQLDLLHAVCGDVQVSQPAVVLGFRAMARHPRQ